MRALILAAGRGERMGVLTQHTPKPLLKVAGHYLIEYAIANAKRAGIREIVINLFYHGQQIKDALGDGQRYGVHLVYSEESERLEVGGGIIHALPLLDEQPFVVMSGDVITDYPLNQLPKEPVGLAHLVMVDNPPFNAVGDFGMREGYADLQASPKLNFGNVGVYQPALFKTHHVAFMKWRDVVFPAIENRQVTAEYYQGAWHNIGTPADLEAINQQVEEDSALMQLINES